MQQVQSPVDNVTYNLIASLHSSLEAVEVCQKYIKDDPDGETGKLFRQLADEYADQSRRLLDMLRSRL